VTDKDLNLPMQTSSAVTSQATDVEKSRAIAHVQAAYTVADARPRVERLALERMLETCSLLGMAERAFFRFPRAGKPVTGMTVHLARELARIWRNMQYGKAELRRDMVRHESEMIAYAVDLETNTRVETTFLVPHLRDGGKGVLTDPREIYETLANMGSRREREMIKSILPSWFTDQAEAQCRQTLETGGRGGKPLPQRISEMLDAYARIGVKRDRLVSALRKPESEWEGRDVADLAITYRSLQEGTLTIEEAFPSLVITPASIAAQAGKQAVTAPPVAWPPTTPIPEGEGEGSDNADE
jgi:hypothetical protein